MPGLYLQDFSAGQVIQHELRRTITESDNMLFSNMTLNPQPLHIDFDFAARSEWGKPLVNSLFTLGLLIGISVNDTTVGTTIANLGMTDVIFPHPMFHGDTLRVKRRSSRCATPARSRIAASSNSNIVATTRTVCWWPSAAARP